MNNRSNCHYMSLYNCLGNILCRHLHKIHCKNSCIRKNILCRNRLYSHHCIPNHIPFLPRFL